MKSNSTILLFIIYNCLQFPDSGLHIPWYRKVIKILDPIVVSVQSNPWDIFCDGRGGGGDRTFAATVVNIRDKFPLNVAEGPNVCNSRNTSKRGAHV